MTDADDALEMSKKGLRASVAARPGDWLDKLWDSAGAGDRSYLEEITNWEREQRELDAERRRSALAQRETMSGFPTLHAHTLVSIWGAIEALVSNLAVAFLTNREDTIYRRAFAKIRVHVQEFQRRTPEERMSLVVEDFSRDLSVVGVDRFDSILSAVGLPGRSEPDVCRDLHELRHLRNALVHRGGVVDLRLKESCPRLSLEMGQRILVTEADYSRYIQAVRRFLWSVEQRLQQFFRNQRGPNTSPT